MPITALWITTTTATIASRFGLRLSLAAIGYKKQQSQQHKMPRIYLD